MIQVLVSTPLEDKAVFLLRPCILILKVAKTFEKLKKILTGEKYHVTYFAQLLIIYKKESTIPARFKQEMMIQ